MDISAVKELWKPKADNRKASVDWWNGMAEKFSARELPTAKESIGMRIIERENMIGKGSKVLDVGCGGGRYSFALEALGAEVTATDFSPEMIKNAKEDGESSGSNVCFSLDDWHTVSLKERNWEKKFDLVLANMTPAVVSADTFMKLIEASRGWVVMVKPTRRTGSILDDLNRLVNAGSDRKTLDEALAYAFDLAWLTGGYPKLEYEEQVWKNDLPLEAAIPEYTLRISATHELSDSDRKKIREYLENAAVDGIVHETTNTSIAAMYWHVK